MKVLLLEDTKMIAEFVLQLVLKDCESVVWVENGKEGLTWLNKIEEFDLVISDYQMPLLNGLGFIDELRKKNTSVPVVLFTANSELYEEREAVKNKHKIQGVFKKDFTELIDYVENFK